MATIFYDYFVGWSKTTTRRLTDGGVGHSRGCDVTNEGKVVFNSEAGILVITNHLKKRTLFLRN